MPDEINFKRGTLAQRPAAGSNFVTDGQTINLFQDQDTGILYVDDGSGWVGYNSEEADDTAYLTLAVDDETGTSYTVVVGDTGRVKRFTNAAAVTVTLPDGVAVGTVVDLVSWGAGGIVVTGNGTSTVQGGGSVGQYGSVSALVVEVDTWLVTGAVL